MNHDFRTRPLSPVEARVLATLMEKARTVPDSYPLSLNSLHGGCNQKTAREPVMSLSEAQISDAIDVLRDYSMVIESSGSRVPRYEHNLPRAAGVPDQSATLLGLLMLRGPQTAGELRIKVGPVTVPDDGPKGLEPGEIRVDKKHVHVGTATDAVLLGTVQPPGKKPMSAADWARGARAEDIRRAR